MNQVQVFPTPVKSEADKKEYRLIKLPNGVKALLVRKASDTLGESDKDSLAAANVTIRIGSFDDPPKALGLAHFLEHMVHMGSVRYPGESTYNDFISANGGVANAFTRSENTGYYFNVSENKFPEALDRLVQLIETPLLLKGSMQREREVVDSEFQMKKANEAVQVESILKSLISEAHPARLFSFGNLKTLEEDISDDDLHSELLKLHSKYLGNKIVIAVQSKRSLDELQELVVKSFSSIESGSEKDKEPQPIESIFTPEFISKMFFVKPKSAKKTMIMSFAVPPLQPHYKCAPVDYLSYVFYNKGEGGLEPYLKDKYLINSIEISEFMSNSMFSVVQITCELTNKGAENIGEVLNAIFSYLLMLKQTAIEEHRRVFTTEVERSERNFSLAEEQSPSDNVTGYTHNMLNYDDIDAVRGAAVFQEFDESLIVDTIDRLNQRKFNLMFITDKHEKYDQKEKYFGTEYDEIDFPAEYQRLWDERKANPEFFLEKPNHFITTSLEIFKVPEESQTHPVKILDTLKVRAWHKLDAKFNNPNVYFYVQIISPLVRDTLKNYLCIELFKECLKFHLKKKLSQALNANYGVTLDDNRNGLTFKFKGYNQKIALFIDIFTKFLPICMAETDESLFNTIKEKMKTNYFKKLLRGGILNNDYFSKILLERHGTKYELYEEIGEVTLSEVKDLMLKFFQKLKVEALVQGNMTKNQALKILDTVEANLNFEHLEQDIELKQRCYVLPFAASVIRIKSLAPKNDNSVIRNFYQIGPDTNRARNLASLVASILDPKAYDFLRTKMQLGYNAECFLEERGGLVGLSVMVLSQESKNSYRKVSEVMDTFVNNVATKTMAELTDEEFETFKEARIRKLLAEDLNVKTEVEKGWAEIVTQNYMFDRFELRAKDTKSISKSDLQDFFDSFTQLENMRKFGVHVIGNHPESSNSLVNETHREPNLELITERLNDDENVVTDIADFRSKLYLHPLFREFYSQ